MSDLIDWLSYPGMHWISIVIWIVGLFLVVTKRKRNPRACGLAAGALACFNFAWGMENYGYLYVEWEEFAVLMINSVGWVLLIAAFLVALKPPAPPMPVSAPPPAPSPGPPAG